VELPPPRERLHGAQRDNFTFPVVVIIRVKEELEKPKMRWVDGVDQDSERTGERYWMSRASDKDEWKKLLRKARAHPGL
jgi:hypothetical protein